MFLLDHAQPCSTTNPAVMGNLPAVLQSPESREKQLQDSLPAATHSKVVVAKDPTHLVERAAGCSATRDAKQVTVQAPAAE